MITTQTLNPVFIEKKIIPNYSKRNFFSERFQRSTLFVDILLLNIILLLGLLYSIQDSTIFTDNIIIWSTFFISANAVWLTISIFNDIYKWYEIIRPFRKVQKLLYVNGLFISILSSLYYYVYFPFFTINFLLPVFILFALFSISSHLLFRNHYQKIMPTFKYVIVGGKPEKLRQIQHIYEDACQGKSKCLGYFAENPIRNTRWLGDSSLLKNYIQNKSFDKLFYINSDLPQKEISKIMELCESRFIDVEIILSEFDFLGKDARIINQEKLSTLAPKLEPLQRQRNTLLKRTFDILLSLIVIITVFPWLFLIIAFFIKLESSGPVFFFQTRTGYFNKPFQCIKFRSMTVNTQSDNVQAVRNDARITRVGAFLRKTNLDELPQFFNVLFGDMTIVGPRPHMLKHTAEYANLIDMYMIRHKVKPGITGWAQINGYRGPTETLEKMQKRVEYDVHYMKNWTFLMDIRCVLFTIINMMRGEENAY